MSELLPDDINKKQAILLLIVFCILNWFAYLFYKQDVIHENKTECGIILKKYTNNDVYHHKHSTSSSINMYFDIKFDNGKYEQINVSTDTYYKNQENNRVCFIRRVDKEMKFFNVVVLLVGGISFIADIVGCLVLFCYGIDRFWNYLSKE